MRHTHKYELILLGQKGDYPVYRCALPDCTHYLRKVLGLGKSSLCWKCGETFVLTSKLRETKRPKCEPCRSGVKKTEVVMRKIEEKKPSLDVKAADDILSLMMEK